MIVITGGAGFIGSNLVAALAARGERVVVSDRLGSGDKWRNLAKHEIEDFVRPESLLQFLAEDSARVRAVVHLGAISDTTATDGDALAAVNFQLSKQLWLWCAQHNKPFLYASSAATYGDGGQGYQDDASIEYLAGLRPLNAYAWSKHAFDRWVARRLADGGPVPMQWAGLKFFNVYGPNEYHKAGQASVAYQLFGQIRNGGPARLFASENPDFPDGGQKRDFVWVGDCVEVLLWLLDDRQINGIFNVGTGVARSFADLAGAVFKALGKPADITYVPMPEALREKYQYLTEAKTERIRAAGFETPFTSLEKGVALYVKDFLDKDDPYR